MKKLGSRLAVYRGKAVKTTGGLTKSMLSKSKFGKIVSKKNSYKPSRNQTLKGSYRGEVVRRKHLNFIEEKARFLYQFLKQNNARLLSYSENKVRFLSLFLNPNHARLLNYFENKVRFP